MQGEVQSSSARLAVLIDADNANPNLIEPLLQEIAIYGVAHVKRVYSDWTDQHSNAWKPKLHKLSNGTLAMTQFMQSQDFPKLAQ